MMRKTSNDENTSNKYLYEPRLFLERVTMRNISRKLLSNPVTEKLFDVSFGIADLPTWPFSIDVKTWIDDLFSVRMRMKNWLLAKRILPLGKWRITFNRFEKRSVLICQLHVFYFMLYNSYYFECIWVCVYYSFLALYFGIHVTNTKFNKKIIIIMSEKMQWAKCGLS